MSGTDLIVAALAAGGSAGITNVATASVNDAYTQLKDLLRRRLGPRAQIVDVTETDRAALARRIGADLDRCGASSDEEILAAARAVLTLAGNSIDVRDSRGVQIGDHNTQHNTFH